MFAVDEDELKAITRRLVATAIDNQVAMRRHLMGPLQSGEVIGYIGADTLSAADLEGLINQIEQAVRVLATSMLKNHSPPDTPKDVN